MSISNEYSQAVNIIIQGLCIAQSYHKFTHMQNLLLNMDICRHRSWNYAFFSYVSAHTSTMTALAERTSNSGGVSIIFEQAIHRFS